MLKHASSSGWSIAEERVACAPMRVRASGRAPRVLIEMRISARRAAILGGRASLALALACTIISAHSVDARIAAINAARIQRQCSSACARSRTSHVRTRASVVRRPSAATRRGVDRHSRCTTMRACTQPCSQDIIAGSAAFYAAAPMRCEPSARGSGVRAATRRPDPEGGARATTRGV
jgi:hypothetical protein